MGRSYRQCTECGKRALSIATRCPACGRELTEPAVREPGGGADLGRLLSPKAIMAVLVAAAVLGAAVLGDRARPSGKHALSTADSLIGASVEVGFSSTAALDLDSTSAAALPATNAGELLVARTWTSVRKSRRVGGELEAVLLPGDTVLADSLSRGWYRVTLEGEVLGYAHRSTLVAPGPAPVSP